MQTTTILVIIISFFVSFALAGFQYFFKNNQKSKINKFLFFVKAFSFFGIFLLFINPKIENIKTTNKKPILSVLVDNSLSVKFFKESEVVKKMVETFKANKKLNEKFDINFYGFGNQVNVLDSLTFDKTQTNISKAIYSVNQISGDLSKTGATVLISDGNQTIGNDYEFTESSQNIYPLVIGDTLIYNDLRISQLNVNKYSYLHNEFPVEVMLYYDGKGTQTKTFSIHNNGKKVFTKKVTFTEDQPSQTINATLKSNQKGVHYYKASIENISKEKNIKNNSQSFSVEVLDEQTKVLVLTSFLHPDLGAFKKAIEANKQRKVTISLVENFKKEINDYQLVVFYQPNYNFKKYFNVKKSNFIIVTGTKTDWNFIKSLNLGFSKNSIEQTENYLANYNTKFLTFLQKDINFSSFPPLKDKFGDIKITTEYQPLLFQKVVGVITDQPLIATFNNNTTNVKFATIFGEGIWKWRASSYKSSTNFEDFDEFLGNLIQYVASNKKRKRLEVLAKRIVPENSKIKISAFYLDNNYNFDKRALLKITIINKKTKVEKSLPFSLINNSYFVDIEGLVKGDYTYKVSVEGQDISARGNFKVTTYQVEEQFVNANVNKLNKLALKTGGKLYFKANQEALINNLYDNKTYYTTQSSVTKEENLINWKWLLLIITTLLAVEWFIRKYNGMI